MDNMLFCKKHQELWAPLASSVKKKHFKAWFICPGLDAHFSTRWAALLVSPPALCYLQGVQDKMQGSSLHQQCLLLLRLKPFLKSWFQITNSSTWHHSAMEHKTRPKANTNDGCCVSISWNKSGELCLQMKAELVRAHLCLAHLRRKTPGHKSCTIAINILAQFFRYFLSVRKKDKFNLVMNG